ncbi:hypothetical protein Tco_0762157 [Tanacetum coccineum]
MAAPWLRLGNMPVGQSKIPPFLKVLSPAMLESLTPDDSSCRSTLVGLHRKQACPSSAELAHSIAYSSRRAFFQMSMATSALAEAYVMRKHHQEKMKKTTITTKDSILDDDDHVISSTIGCFPTLFKKIHPSSHSNVAVSDSTLRRHKS